MIWRVLRLALEAVSWIATMAIFSVLYFLSLDKAEATELIVQGGYTSWSRCSGAACWDQSGDPKFPLPVAWDTEGASFAAGGRYAELEVMGQYLGPGRGVVRGLYVDDTHFDPKARNVKGTPPRVIDASVDQWTTGLTAKWAPRWQLAWGVYVQPEVGLMLQHTRWAINWTKPHTDRADGSGTTLTPMGGVKLLAWAGPKLLVGLGVEAYHRPTVQTAPLGGGARGGPGLIQGVLELRMSL